MSSLDTSNNDATPKKNANLIAEVQQAYQRHYSLTRGLKERLCAAIADADLIAEIETAYKRKYDWTQNFKDRICAALSQT